jgi:hypothetical protein
MLYEDVGADKKKEEEPTTSSESKQEEPAKTVEHAPKPNFETDISEIHTYNLWHQAFYSRPSIFLPNPPPKLKIPPLDIMSQINVAARFVAGNGGYAEMNLIGMDL